MRSPETRSRRTQTRLTIRRRVEGGFQVVRGKQIWIVATPAAGGLRVARGRSTRWFLERVIEAGGTGYVLRAGPRKEAPEAARSTRLPLGAGRELAGTHFVVADGRVFVVMADLNEGLFRLMSWEGFGPYATIVPKSKGFTFEVTPAGTALVDDAELVALLAAELVDDPTRMSGDNDEKEA